MCMLCLHNDIFTDITGNDWLKFSTIYTFPKNEILGKPLVGISVMDKAVDYRILSSFTDGELAYVTCFDLDRRTCSNSASGTVLHDVNKDCWCLPDLIVLTSLDVYQFTCLRDLFLHDWRCGPRSWLGKGRSLLFWLLTATDVLCVLRRGHARADNCDRTVSRKLSFHLIIAIFR